MPAYIVRVIDRQGICRSLREVAPNEERLRENLRAQALWPVRVRELPPERKIVRLKVPTREFIALLHQLELQLRAGVNADAALAQLAEDAPKGALRTILEEVHRQVAQGSPIHTACRYFERQFPGHVAAVIAAGEASAQLPEVLRALAGHLTSVDGLRRTAGRALIYPVVVAVATFGLIIFLLGGVVPKFAEIFTSLRLELPALTRVMIQASELVRNQWVTLVVALAVAGYVAWLCPRVRMLRDVKDRILLRLPVLGETVRCLATARFAAHCRLLHGAGIPLLEALATGAELTNHAVLSRNLLVAREGVAAGQPLYAALPQGHAFPGFFVPALKSGETTGQLAAALHHIEEYAAERARERLATALALMEPALLAALTALVGAVALSFFLPLFSLLGGVNAR